MAKVSIPTGYRFHPTDEELVMCYLKKKVMGKRLPSEAVTEIELYKNAPWEFQGMSQSKDLEWYFFCSPHRKYKIGSRKSRVTKYGYWKTTGKDKPIWCGSQVVGKRRTLIFYKGKAPSRDRTEWVMHEFRLEDKKLADASICQDRFVVCKIFEKSGPGPKNGEQYGAPFEEEADDDSDGDGGDNLSGSLTPHRVAIPRSSSLLPEKGQDASMISSTLDFGDGQNFFPQYFEAPDVFAQHPYLEHDDVHSLPPNVPDEDGDISNKNDVRQADSIVLNKTTVEDAKIFNGLEDLESKKYLEDENVEDYMEMNDLLKPMEVEDYQECNDFFTIEAFFSDHGISANHSLARGKQIKVPLIWESLSIGRGALPNGHFLLGFIPACSASVEGYPPSLECGYYIYRGGWSSCGSNINDEVTVTCFITQCESGGTVSIW